jgi:hypothetical protein
MAPIMAPLALSAPMVPLKNYHLSPSNGDMTIRINSSIIADGSIIAIGTIRSFVLIMILLKQWWYSNGDNGTFGVNGDNGNNDDPLVIKWRTWHHWHSWSQWITTFVAKGTIGRNWRRCL